MTSKSQFLGVLEGSQTRSGEVDSRLKTGDMLIILGVDIGKDVVSSLSRCVSKKHRRLRDWRKRGLTGGMAVGRSTLFVMVIWPFSRGQERSTLPSCSHRSAVVESSWMRPYLTVTLTYAPFVMVFLTSPVAVMRSVAPLSMLLVQRLAIARRSSGQILTASGGWELDRLSGSR